MNKIFILGIFLMLIQAGLCKECTPGQLMRNPKNCSEYYFCNVHGNKIRSACEKGLLWNNDVQMCDFPQNVACDFPTFFKPIAELLDSPTIFSPINEETFCKKTVMCYLTNGAKHRQGRGKFLVKDIDPNMCSHIVYAYASVVGNKLDYQGHNNTSSQWDKGTFDAVNDLKKDYPFLKTMLAVGGWKHGSLPFSTMVETKAQRQIFIDSVVKVLRMFGFDGLSLNWMYPASRGGKPQDKQRFTLLCTELMQAFTEESKKMGKGRLMLAIAVAARKQEIDIGYEMDEVSKSADYIELMSYDYKGVWDSETGHHSLLYPAPNDKENNIEWSAKYWIDNGTPKNKILVGIPTYGRSFTLKNVNMNKTHAPATKGRKLMYSNHESFATYYEICDEWKKGGVSKNTIDRSPYFQQGNLWVCYDDPDSVGEKAQYIMAMGFGGAMIYALDFDDFNGNSCGQGKYPLISQLIKTFDEFCGIEIPKDEPEGSYNVPILLRSNYTGGNKSSGNAILVSRLTVMLLLLRFYL